MKYYQKFLSDFQESFYMHATLGIILSSCLGAAAAMLVLMNGHALLQMVQLFVITCICMGFNTTVLANLKPKVVFNTLMTSLVLNTAFILYYIF
ncbi:hypothetical protein C7S20_18985 [Christiangramia fulva]|nr:hypothetical protein C7S20_18985 [Christiangramia fulva]